LYSGAVVGAVRYDGGDEVQGFGVGVAERTMRYRALRSTLRGLAAAAPSPSDR